MPFPPQAPQPFMRSSIEALAPNQVGCYGLFSRGQCIYVGKGDIRQRLLDHLNGDNACILLNRPTHFLTVVAANPDLTEVSLIRELHPSCNRRVG